MPRRDDLKTILIIGSGPIVIGQGCEFDYSGTQACKALREEGYRIVLINSNPATIMTDPEFADRTYIEPITPAGGGQDHRGRARPTPCCRRWAGRPALNTAAAVADAGVLEQYGVEMIGATRRGHPPGRGPHRVQEHLPGHRAGRAPKRRRPHDGRGDGGGRARSACRSASARPTRWAARAAGSPSTSRSSSTIAARGLEYSPISEILIEESVLGWKEYELEVMRDKADNVVIVCSIENFDPMGVHTGDSITVAPAQTLTDKEYQLMRDAAIAVIRAIGVETGGSNIQFAVAPRRPGG